MSELTLPTLGGSYDQLVSGLYPEQALIHGTGIIFVLPDNSYMFFRRDDNPNIPYPGRIALIGGRSLPGEPGHITICREVSEELFYIGTDKPVELKPDKLEFVTTIADDRPGVIDVFAYELDLLPEELEIREGKGLVELPEEDVLSTYFPYSYTEAIHEYVKKRQSKKMASFCLEASVNSNMFQVSDVY